MAWIIESADFWRFGVVLTTITVANTIVSRPQFLLLKVQCLISCGEAITPGIIRRLNRHPNLDTKTSGE